MKYEFFIFIFLVIFIFPIAFDVSHAKSPRSFSEIQASNSTQPWLDPAKLIGEELKPKLRFAVAGILSFIAAAISSAGGIGGGGLYIPILTIVGGLELKAASSYSAFMVTGGSIANVGFQMLGKRRLIDYDIALLSEPCMLLGVSCGVICNLVFPAWLITVIFAVFLAFSTFKTCKSGVSFWGLESRKSTEMPLLDGGNFDLGIPLVKLGMLFLIWFSFFVLYILRGNRYGQGIINIEVCGTGYWIISTVQIPVAIIFTAWILHCRNNQKNTTAASQQESEAEPETSSASCRGVLFFPVMALLAGLLGGVFGIGGGMLISPLLLQIGIRPEVTAATCSFMVFFSSTMSAIQYLLLGMDHVYDAVTYAAICFVASLVGLTLVQRAIMKYGRASLIVFSVGTVMALSTVLITSFGAVDVWKDYVSGKNMGFKNPC